MKEICTLLVKLYIICSRMQRVNLHARPSIIQVGCPTCCYQVCPLDHAKWGTAELGSHSQPCRRNAMCISHTFSYLLKNICNSGMILYNIICLLQKICRRKWFQYMNAWALRTRFCETAKSLFVCKMTSKGKHDKFWKHTQRLWFSNKIGLRYAWIILGMGTANKRWGYHVTSSLIGWACTQNDPWVCWVHLFGNESSPKPMLIYCQLNPLKIKFVQVLIKIQIFSFNSLAPGRFSDRLYF